MKRHTIVFYASAKIPGSKCIVLAGRQSIR